MKTTQERRLSESLSDIQCVGLMAKVWLNPVWLSLLAFFYQNLKVFYQDKQFFKPLL